MNASQRQRKGCGRRRSKVVAFRLAPEEAEALEHLVRLSGLSKQDYICCRLLERAVVIEGNPRVYKALREELLALQAELKRIEAGAGVQEELLARIGFIAEVLDGMAHRPRNP